jgi:hypothetical protein
MPPAEPIDKDVPIDDETMAANEAARLGYMARQAPLYQVLITGAQMERAPTETNPLARVCYRAINMSSSRELAFCAETYFGYFETRVGGARNLPAAPLAAVTLYAVALEDGELRSRSLALKIFHYFEGRGEP